MTVKNSKIQAGKCLQNKRLRVLRITLLKCSAAVLSGFAAYLTTLSAAVSMRQLFLQFGLQVAICVLTISLLGSLRLGRTAWLYCSACGKEPSGVQFLYWMRRGRGFRASALYLILRIRKAAWTILLALPGITVLTAGLLLADQENRIVQQFTWIGGAVCLAIGLVFACLINQKYALAPILLACSPDKSVRSVVRNSCFLMEDDCVRLLRMKLSFLPWALVCVTVFPIAYVIPYYQQTKTCMLRSILRAHTI